MFEDKNINLITNIISILENREDTWYFELKKKNSNSLIIQFLVLKITFI